jgi:transposase
MRFVPIKTEQQQAVLSLHRARVMLVKQRTQTTNAIRALLAEYGIVRSLGRAASREVLELARRPSRLKIPDCANATLKILAKRVQTIITQIEELNKHINTWHLQNEDSQRLATIPGIGELAATALVASIGNPSRFGSGRDLSAWLGLVPRQRSSGSKTVLGPISKNRNSYLRQLLYLGAKVLILKKSKHAMVRWAVKKTRRKPYKIAIIALANKMARIAWALLHHKQQFRPDMT